MTRFFVPLAAAVLTASLAQASSVISCSGDKDAVNSCINGHLASFTARLDLGAVAGDSTLNNVFNNNVTWASSNVLPGMDISVHDVGTSAGSEGLVRAYNLAYFLDGGEWTPGDHYSPAFPYGGFFNGRFNSASNPAGGEPVGDVLLGLKLNSASSTPYMLLSFGANGFDNIGFRISSILTAGFTAHIEVLSGIDGTGTTLYSGDLSFNDLGNPSGGTCATLAPDLLHGQPNPIPCNNAPFIGLMNFENTAHSIKISTNDAGGFYIGEISAGYQAETPEPGTIVLSCCGLAAVFFARRRAARKA